MSKARQLADLGNVYDDGALSNRNLVTNGGMTVAQRGNVAVTQAATAYGGADRWLMYPNIGGTASSTVAQTAVTWTESKFAQGMTATTTSTAGSILFIQRIESINTSHLADNKVTLQFKLAHDVGSTLTVQLLIQRPTTTADDFSAATDILGATTIGTCPTGTSSGTLFTYTSDTLTSADVSKGFQIQIRVVTASAVTNKNFYLGDVQLEVGDTATPFEHRSYGDELARCQRYFQILMSKGQNYHAQTMWVTNTLADSHSMALMFPHEMRAAPTGTLFGTPVNVSGGSVGTSTWSIYGTNGWRGAYDLLISEVSTTSCRIDCRSNDGATAGGAVGLYGGSDCYWELDAEL